MLRRLSSRVRLGLVAALACLLAATAYWPGLSGGFLFDDFVNLASLGAYGPVDDWHTLLLYLSSGIADPTGRPVSVASFLIDARDWPADPWPFKRTNLILHLLNGMLLAVVLARLESWLRSSDAQAPESRRAWIALLGAMLWLAHPLFVSTTLYVVQRHAMLPLTFVLLALLCWDRVAARLLAGRRTAAWTWGLLGLWPAFALAGLSKANGLLAPLLVLACHALLLQPRCAAAAPAQRRAIRHAAGWLLALPGALVLLAFWQRIPDSLDWAGTRRFTLGERMLTEPRVLFDYLQRLLAPRAGGGGVFVEDYAKSTGLLEPWTTLAALLGLAALLAGAWVLRRRAPRLALAIVFFLIAHLMESSAIMLDLYFEHRNYLPAALLFWPAAHWIVAGRLLPRIRPALAFALPSMLLALTWQRATVWGDPLMLAQMSALAQPDSVRARVVSAAETGSALDPRRAVAELRETLARKGPGTSLVFNLLGQECGLGEVPPDTRQAMRAALRNERGWHVHTIRWLRSAIDFAASGRCRGLDLDEVAQWLAVIESNPHANSSSARRQSVLHLRALFELRSGRADAALAGFDRALAERPDPDTALTQAALLGQYGAASLGLRHLDYYATLPAPPPENLHNMQSLHRWILLRSAYHETEIANLRRTLEESAAEAAGAHPAAVPVLPAGSP
jgi:protein O-mannosyl-transferase